MEPTNRQRVVLLGASNVAISWKPLLQILASGFDNSLDIHTAHGMGRSYISSSHFAWRRLPGIMESSLWDHLSASPNQSSTKVLLTDLGNDLVYGRSAEDVYAVAKQCIARLLDHDPNCDIVVTRPPVDSVLDVSAWKYQAIRRLLFPKCSLSLPQVKSVTVELDDLMTQIEDSFEITLIRPERSWYGFDPIHIRRERRGEVFAGYFENWSSWSHRKQSVAQLPVTRPVPAVRYLFGKQRSTDQPCIDSQSVRVFAY